MATPPAEVQAAILADASLITRRIEIYEQDAETLWHPGPGLVDGSVTVDSSRDERRTATFTIANLNGDLDNYPGGFWYDKIIRAYRGVEYSILLNAANSIEVEEPIVWFRLSAPVSNIVVDSGSSRSDATVVGDCFAVSTGAFVGDETGSFAFNGGHLEISDTWDIDIRRKYSISVWIKTEDNDPGAIYVASDWATTDAGLSLTLNETTPGRITLRDGSDTYVVTLPGVIDGEWHQIVATCGTLKTRIYVDGALVHEEASPSLPRPARLTSGAWIGAHPGASMDFIGSVDELAIFKNDLAPSIVYGQYQAGRGTTARDTRTWECMLGDFMVDDIGTSNFPNKVSVSCRDLTKRLLLSKFKVATAFQKGMSIEELVGVIATNGGISKFVLPSTGRSIGKDFYFDRGVSRWEAINQIAVDYGYDIYFDASGFMVMSEPSDPATTAPVFTFKTGPDGSIATFDKKTRDTRIYNVIVVTGESTDTAPVYAIAENHEPSSPTRIAIPGEPGGLSERVYQYTSSFITTTDQAQDVADKFLKVHALEEFEVGMGTLVIPWLDAGTIIEFLDPSPNPGDPTRYLMSNFTIPLGLGPMSVTGKRVTIVG